MSLNLFSKNLKHLRAKHNLTREQAATLIRVPVKTYASWEQARCYPDTNTLSDICDAFNYFDIYKLINTDIEKAKAKADKLPAILAYNLKQIISIANNTLTA